jgi:riboflavin kinase/FMN adenylyltransferase
VGPRPTFQGSPPSIELHLLEFARDIYGEEVRVDIVEFLRPVVPFESAEALVRQMRLDVGRAREVLDADGPYG